MASSGTSSYSGTLYLGDNITFQGALGISVSRKDTSSVRLTVNTSSYIYAPGGCGSIQVQVGIKKSSDSSYSWTSSLVNKAIYQNVTYFSSGTVDIIESAGSSSDTFNFAIWVYDNNNGQSGYLWGNNLTLDYDVAITNVTNPSTFTTTPAIVAPNGTITCTWSGATAGIGNNIKSYEIILNGNVVKTINSSATSGSTTITAISTRGTSSTYQIKTIPTVSGYGPNSGKTASAAVSINQLPNRPTPTTLNNTIIASTSDGYHPTVTPGTDSDSSQTTSVYYSIGTGNKIQYTNSTKLKPSNTNDPVTYRFYTYDGIEFSTNYTQLNLMRQSAPEINDLEASYDDSVKKYYDNTSLSNCYENVTLSNFSFVDNRPSGWAARIFTKLKIEVNYLLNSNVVGTALLQEQSYTSGSVALGDVLANFNSLSLSALDSNNNYTLQLKITPTDNLETGSVKTISINSIIPKSYGSVNVYDNFGDSNLSNINYFYNKLRFKVLRNDLYTKAQIYYSNNQTAWNQLASFNRNSIKTSIDDPNNYIDAEISSGHEILTNNSQNYYFKIRCFIGDNNYKDFNYSGYKIRIPYVSFSNPIVSPLQVYNSNSLNVLSLGVTDFSSAQFINNYGLLNVGNNIPKIKVYINNLEIYCNGTSPGEGVNILTKNDTQILDTVSFNFSSSQNKINYINAVFGNSDSITSGTWKIQFPTVYPEFKNTYTFSGQILNHKKAPVVSSLIIKTNQNSNTWILNDTNKWIYNSTEITRRYFQGQKIKIDYSFNYWYPNQTYKMQIFKGEGNGINPTADINWILVKDDDIETPDLEGTYVPLEGITYSETDFEYTFNDVFSDEKIILFKIVVSYNPNNENSNLESNKCQKLKFGTTIYQISNITTDIINDITNFIVTRKLTTDYNTTIANVEYKFTNTGIFKITPNYDNQEYTKSFSGNSSQTNYSIQCNSCVHEGTPLDLSRINKANCIITWAEQLVQSDGDDNSNPFVCERNIETNIYLFYNLKPTVAYRKGAVGINENSLDQHDVLNISGTSSRYNITIQLNDENNNHLTLNLSDGKLICPTINGRTPTIDLLTGTISGFVLSGDTYNDDLLLTTESSQQ